MLAIQSRIVRRSRHFLPRRAVVLIRVVGLAALAIVTGQLQAAEPFVVRVVDADTKRGVPLVELTTTHNVRFITDSAGLIAIDAAAIDDAGLLNEEVFFFVASHGYEYDKDGFGNRGTRLRVEPGKSAELSLKRLNIAQRLYRITGAGLYDHTLCAGKQAPLQHPRINAQVVGCDSTQTAIFDGKIFWVWGDTSRLRYPLGNFHGSAATSRLPGDGGRRVPDGGLDPSVGVDLEYFKSNDGFAREIARMPGSGPTWLTALATVTDDNGREHLVAAYNKIKPPLAVYERGLCEFDPQQQQFIKLFAFDKSAPVVPSGHAFCHAEGQDRWLYLGEAVPHMRVRDRYESLKDPSAYEAVKADARFTDATRNKPVKHHHGSVAWSSYRKKWVSIFVQEGGESSYLGEIYYAESNAPEGPWRKAVKIMTHDRYSFYNPKQHPYFSDEQGQYLYFEGTYTTTFSRRGEATPLYDYNQIMCRLDLSDRRLDSAR